MKTTVEALKDLTSKKSDENSNIDFSEIEKIIDEKLSSFEQKINNLCVDETKSLTHSFLL